MEVITNQGVVFMLDDYIYPFIEKLKYHYDKTNGYIRLSINGKNYYLHRLLLNAKKGQIVDHKNRDRLDNRLSNLRIVSHALNAYNQKSNPNRGLYFDKCGNRWRANISHMDKSIKLGSFKTKEEAMVAYNKKSIELYGNDAFVHHFEIKKL